jgi:hypothetical protein
VNTSSLLNALSEIYIRSDVDIEEFVSSNFLRMLEKTLISFLHCQKSGNTCQKLEFSRW